eukprot:scaffold2113_cov146-Skeletonema_menzelii.AAC.7
MAPPTMTSIAIICFCLLGLGFCCDANLLAARIHQSHIFYVSPQDVVNSVLSNIRQHHRRPLLDIDVSCSNLNDDAVISLVEGILNIKDGTTETVLNLKLEMNRISPSGVSKVFDLLVGESNDKVEESKETAENSQMADISDESPHEASCVQDNNATSHTISNATIIEADSSHEETTITSAAAKPSLCIEKLDLSYNDVGGEGTNPPSAQLLNSVRRLFENEQYSTIPNILLMENCNIGAAFCRSIGRGICNAYEKSQTQSNLYRPSILRIGGNPIGDAGAVALAAAFRMATSNDNNGGDGAIMEELDLSSCNIGDVGAEAIALALACNPSSLKRLDLSNNKITDVGAIALGRALIESRERASSFALEQIILDNNVGIGDEGAAVLAKAVSSGAVRSVHLRSCSIRADGAAEFAKALVEIVKRSKIQQFQSAQIDIDLSGNHFGISKPKKKKGAAYSASLLRDKASSNIRFIGKSLQSRIKGGFGLGLTTAESDDDEEEMGNVMGEILSDDEDFEEIDSDRLKAIARCGARLFSSEILNTASESSVQKQASEDTRLNILIGMRQCFLDNGAIDALAAAKVFAKKAGTTLSIDIAMNAGIDDATITALKGGEDEELLSSIAERHSNEIKRILEAEERRAAAAEVAAARVQDTFLEDDLFDNFDDDYDEY